MSALIGNPLMLTSAPSGDDSFKIEKSLRFNRPDNPSLVQVPSSSGNTRVWTWSGWVKRAGLGTEQDIFGCVDPDSTGIRTAFRFESTDKLAYGTYSSSSWQHWSQTTAVFRDIGAWYHIVLACDTTQATAADRTKLYVNGKRVTMSSDPAQYLVTYANYTGVDRKIGDYGSSSNELDGYLADVHFIDGLQLSAAAFGSFGSSGVWNPIDPYDDDAKFKLPAPNDGSTWSTYGTWSGDSSTDRPKAFDGNLSTYHEASSSNTSMLWTPTEGISIKTSLRLYLDVNGTHYPIKINDKEVLNHTDTSDGWNDVPGAGVTITSLDKLDIKKGGVSYAKLAAIEVDGVILRDDQKDPETRDNPNNGTEWKNSSFNSGGDSNNYYKIFDGDNSDWMNLTNAASPYTFTPPAGIPITSLRLLIQNDTTYTVALNGGSAVSYSTPTNLGLYPIDLSDHGNITTLTSIALSSAAGGSGMAVRAIEINGQFLVSETVDNSFHLKFNDSANIGINNFSEDLSDSSGKADNARPILKTNSLGTSLTSGYRTDDDSSNLWVAIPFNGTAGGNTVVDESNHINSSSTEKTVTLSSFITSAAESKYYGTSGSAPSHYSRVRIDGSSETAVGEGNYTIEFWLYHTNSGSNNPIYDSRTSGGANGHVLRQTAATTFDWRGPTASLVSFASGAQNTWNHYAIVRSGTGTNQTKIYVNGTQAAECTDTTNASNTGYIYLCKNSDAPDATNHGIAGYFQDFRLYKTNKYTSGFDVEARKDFIDNNINTDPIVKVADATGAKPVLVTTGDYGGGTTDAANTDSDASTLLICLSGKSLTEVEPSGRTAATRTWTAYGDAAVSTDTSRFYGSSFKFDGTGDYISSPDSTDFDMGTTDFTIEAWVYINNLTHHGIVCGQIQDGLAANCAYSLQVDNGLPTFKCFYSTSVFSCISPTKIAAGEWFHMAGVYDGANQFLYINGKLVKTLANPYGVNNGGPDFHLGAALHGSPGNWSRGTLLNGYVQDVRVYKNKLKYTNNFSVTSEGKSMLNDALVDTPTNYGTDSGAGSQAQGNYATLNPLTYSGTLSKGNLTFKPDHASMAAATIAAQSGKYYWEFTCDSNTNFFAGLMGLGGRSDPAGRLDTNDVFTLGGSSGSASTNQAASTKTDHNGGFTGSILNANDVIGIALDADAKTCDVYLNNTKKAAFSSFTHAGPYLWAHDRNGNGTELFHYNFGQRPFKYSAPAGYKCLCTQNLDNTFDSETSENNPSKYFDITTYKGDDSATRTIAGAFEFAPDLIWYKNRDTTNNNGLYDRIRGDGNRLHPDSDIAENTNSGLYGFVEAGTADGSIDIIDGSDGTYNMNSDGDNVVVWAWDAGTTAATASSSGNITPSAQWVNATAGFSISKYAGSLSNTGVATVGHGLNAPPELVITKSISSDTRWSVTHTGLTNWNYILELNDNDAQADKSGNGSMSAPTNTVFSTNYTDGINVSGQNFMAYCWTPISGYSAFGEYGGNSNANGPFVWTGFRPAYVLIKCKSGYTEHWLVYDNKRNENNVTDNYLYPNLSNAEADDYYPIDILSNGFKLRNSSAGTNGSSGDYIYCAFAEHPFKTARAK